MNTDYLKSLMVEAGFLDPSPGSLWQTPEENAWRHVCALTGLRYTPFPDRLGQDPDLLAKIDALTFSIPRPAPVVQARPDLKQWLPLPVKLDPETPAAIAKGFKTADKIPESFRRPVTYNDPMVGLEPNLDVPRVKRRTGQMSPEKAARLNAAREAETPSSTDVPSVIRVR